MCICYELYANTCISYIAFKQKKKEKERFTFADSFTLATTVDKAPLLLLVLLGLPLRALSRAGESLVVTSSLGFAEGAFLPRFWYF